MKIYAKYVYLFEMDSVRTSPEQIKQAIKALYYETVIARNVVVLSYNQVVDSIPFISMLKSRDSFEDILHLFELGYLKLNQYGNTRTIIQYLLDQLDELLDGSEENSGFLFSGLPVKKNERRLLALIRRCLVNSDLSEIYEYIGRNKSDKDIRDLFVRVIPLPSEEEKKEHPEYKGYEEIGKHLLVPPSDSTSGLLKTLGTLAVILQNLLRLSAIRNIYLPPKKANKNEVRSFGAFLDLVTEKTDLISEKEFKDAIEIIKGLSAFGQDTSGPKKHSGKRSDYHNELNNMEKEAKENSALKGDEYKSIVRTFRYAEAIIDACYNYTCEASILNISRHYDVIKENGSTAPDKETFYADCRLRIMENVETMECFMEKKESDDKDSIDSLPDIRFPRLDHLNKPDGRILYCEKEKDPIVPRYEYKENVLFNRTKLGRIFDFPEVTRNFLLALGLLIISNILLDWLQQFLQFPSTPGWIIVKCICAILAGEFMSFVLAKISEDDALNILLSFIASLVLPICVYLFAGFVQTSLNLTHPAWNILKFVLIIVIGVLETFLFFFTGYKVVYEGSLFEIAGRFSRFLINEFCNFHMFRSSPHVNSVTCAKTDEDKDTSVSEPALPLPETAAMKRYVSFRKKHEAGYFDDSDDKGYRFYDLENADNIRKLYRHQELTGNPFGLIYRSEYSTLLVDPVTNNSSLMAYERVLPGENLKQDYSGAVIIPRINEKYVLIRQFRHAIRREQLCFPRGFAENNGLLNDIKRELNEEISGELISDTSYTILGYCFADSGMTSKKTVIVLADLSSYGKPADPKEAITSGEERSLDELAEMIRTGKIDDGFTITAVSLLMLNLNEAKN